jgi:hypothetical protein
MAASTKPPGDPHQRLALLHEALETAKCYAGMAGAPSDPTPEAIEALLIPVAREVDVADKKAAAIAAVAEAKRKREEAVAAARQAQIDRIQAQEQAQGAALDLVRGEKPMMSGWDGSCHACERYLKQSLNDPDSYQHMESTQPIAEGAFWTVVSRFRAKNGFGALIVATKKFYIQQGEVVRTADVD